MKAFMTYVKWMAVVFMISSAHLALCQTNVYLIAAMDGVLELEDGTTTNFWGYGYQSQSQEIQLPAPLLHFDIDEDVEMHMQNVSPEAHTIHLHGLDVDQANDGVPQTSFQVTQGQSGTYSFASSFPGTYLYHCHVTTTLHLTMGMYGMIVIDGPNNTLYQDGPGFNAEHELLFSDLEVEVNDFPAQAYPFHEIHPDYFMVNGLQGQMIVDDPEQHIQAFIGDSIALRLGSMAYSLINVEFPVGSNPEVHMSDGRVLPEIQTVENLEIYPGERFSVILRPDSDFEGAITVEYFSMLNKELLHTNEIPVENLGVGIADLDELLSWSISPCPSENEISVTKMNKGYVDVFDLRGQWLKRWEVNAGTTRIANPNLPPGTYVLVDENGVAVRHIVK